MILEHTFTVPTDQDTTWRTLLDVERVAPCMPGATLDSIDGDDFIGRVKVKTGAIQMAYRMQGRFVETDEAARVAVIEGSGKESRGGGNVRATITLRLKPAGSSTEVAVETDLAITGKPAQFGRGALDDIGSKIIGQFANNLSEMVTAADESAPADEPSKPEASSAANAASPSAAASTASPTRSASRAKEAEPLDLMSVIAPSPDRIIAVASSLMALVLALVLLRRSVRRDA
ncbi:SRPBCC family protein [Janibacter sp. LM]|uniref:SRPBCC family protein n=1 Tax=Janibacter sp. LM TaxID=3144845 RepID=UPI0031F61919